MWSHSAIWCFVAASARCPRVISGSAEMWNGTGVLFTRSEMKPRRICSAKGIPVSPRESLGLASRRRGVS